MSAPPLAGAVRLYAAARTDRGRQRTRNEDDFLVADLTVPAEDGGLRVTSEDRDILVGPFRITLGPRGALLLVADGMGGGVAGGLASSLATRWIHEGLSEQWNGGPEIGLRRFAACLRRALERANQGIFRHSMEHSEYREMGTTATAAGLLDDTLVLAQVGDSRAYLLRENRIHQLTRDQSLVQTMVDAGTLTEAEADVSPRRHLILQALGPRPEVRVEMTSQALRRGDTLLLCSDGLSSILSRDEIASVLQEASDPAAGCTGLTELANERGGPDNITVVVAVLDGDGLSPPSATDEIGYGPLDGDSS